MCKPVPLSLGLYSLKMHGLLFTLLVGLAQVGADLIRSSKDAQIPPIYPIGTVAKDESVPKAVGRLFEINGQVTYLAGTSVGAVESVAQKRYSDTAVQEPMRGGSAI